MKINFIFIRHGHGCHNAIAPLYKNKLLNEEDARKLYGIIGEDSEKNQELFIDPELTQLGIDASAYNGCILSKTIRKIGYEISENDEFSSINIVGSSPLIRSMETAYEITKSWSVKPDKIFVFPHLREIDESSNDKYSDYSRKVMDTNSSYAMKSIDEQKKYLKKRNLDNIVDFQFVENDLKGRSEPGDISKFIEWFANNIVKNIEPREKINVFIITHAGVLTDFVRLNIGYEEHLKGFFNNTGFILSVNNEENKDVYELESYISLKEYLPKEFFKKYNQQPYIDGKYYCPSDRCTNFCKYIKHDKNAKLQTLKTSCVNKENENLKISKNDVQI